MSDLVIGNAWTPFGLRDDPFFQQALQTSSATTAARPITLFVGRDEEVQLVGRQVIGSSSSRAIIQGDAGVGKTSFINRLKSVMAAHGVLTHADPVRVVSGMTSRQFLAEVLKCLLQIHATLRSARETGMVDKARGFFSRDVGATAEDRFWIRVGRLVRGEDSTAVGVNAAVLGAQRERVRIPAEVEGGSLHAEVEEALRYLAGDAQHRVMIHVNNMENLSREDAAAAAGLMQDVRDVFLAHHGHWLFVGTTGIEDQIFRASDQVSGIIPFGVTLGPLAASEVGPLLARRYEHFRLQPEMTPPVATALAETIYARYHGHLRQFLSLLSNAVQRHSAFQPGVPLGLPEIFDAMSPVLYAQLCRRIDPEDAAHLRSALQGKPFDTEFRVKELQEATQLSQAGASKLAGRLTTAGVITPSRTMGRSLFYRVVHGDDTVALQMQ